MAGDAGGMAGRKKDDADDPELVTRSFCDERTKRVETLIEGMQTKIINAINEKNSMPWQAKATIAAALIGRSSHHRCPHIVALMTLKSAIL